MISIREDFYWMLTTLWQLPFDPSQTENMQNRKPVWNRGNASVYSNTVVSVYEREMKLNRGLNYPEVLEKELSNACENEKAQVTIKSGQAQRKEWRL